MLDICESRISLTRGDSAEIQVDIVNTVSGSPYEVGANDRLFFTVRKFASKSVPVVIEKVLTGSNIFHVAPEDTADLPTGTYKYDVELRSGADVYTVVPCSDFVLTQEVTML